VALRFSHSALSYWFDSSSRCTVNAVRLSPVPSNWLAQTNNYMNTENVVKPEVSKVWLAEKLADPQNQERVIGRALLAIYKNQTLSEQSQTVTKVNNGIGFCKPDARVGSIGARMYKAHTKLEPWVIEIWMRPAKDGFPRICKYATQLNAIAAEKYHMLLEKSKSANVLKNIVLI